MGETGMLLGRATFTSIMGFAGLLAISTQGAAAFTAAGTGGADQTPAVAVLELASLAHEQLPADKTLGSHNRLGAFKRGELGIAPNLKCFLADSGDLFCFSLNVKRKFPPSQNVTRDEKGQSETPQ